MSQIIVYKLWDVLQELKVLIIGLIFLLFLIFCLFSEIRHNTK